MRGPLARIALEASPRAAARFAAAVLSVGGLVGLVNNHFVLRYTTANEVLAMADVAVGLLAWALPWDRWSPRAVGVLAPVGLALISASRVAGASLPGAYGVTFVMVFMWVGLTQPPGTAYPLSALAAVAYLAPGAVVKPVKGVDDAQSLLVVLPVCVLAAELPARLFKQLRKARAIEQADAAASKAAERALADQAALVALLGDIASAANKAMTIDEALQAALDQICLHAGWPLGHAYWVDDASPTLRPMELWFVDDPHRFSDFRQITMGTELALNEGLPGRVLLTGQPVWIPDVSVDEGFTRMPAALDAGLRAAFAFPVVVGADNVAVLEFFAEDAIEARGVLFEAVANIGAQLGRVVERTRAQAALRDSEERLRAVVETASDAFVGMDAAGAITDWNHQAEISFGWRRDEILGRRVVDTIVPAYSRDAHRRGLAHYVRTGEGRVLNQRIEMTALHRDGHEFPVEITVWALASESGPRFSAFVHDITERKRTEEALTRQALYDSLTGLPNRSLFYDRLGHALRHAARHPTSVAVLFLDLDRFKVINDSLGHDVGNQVLVATADRLRSIARASDTVCRLGGDEFVVLAEDVESVGEARAVARRMQEVVAAPHLLADGTAVAVTVSIGIAMGKDDAAVEDLVRDADTAMYRAKELGRSRHEVFDEQLRARALHRLGVERDLRWALDHGGLSLQYQPVVDIETEETVAVEALLRAHGPDGRVLLPHAFLEVAEDSGLIVPIGTWVLRAACAQMAEWRRLTPRKRLQMAVNVSARQLATDGLADLVQDILEETGAQPSDLRVEITESALIDARETTASTVKALKDLGVSLAIDDFGTGYSSLTYLRRFPLDAVKVDRSFVAGMMSDPDDLAIVTAVVSLGQSLGLTVVAEGVENAEQLERLRALGCHFAQGYYIGRPGPAEQVPLRGRRGGRLRPVKPSIAPTG